MKGVVSRVTCGKVLKAFSLEPRDLPTGEPVDTTRQAKLSKLVKAACRYDVLLPKSKMLQTHGQTDGHTHTQNTAINIIDSFTNLNPPLKFSKSAVGMKCSGVLFNLLCISYIVIYVYQYKL